MTNCIATTPQPGILDKPIFYPVKLALTPLLWVVQLVKRAIGYLNSLGVFSNGMWNQSWISRKIIDIYKGGCYDTHNRKGFDPKRLETAYKVLESVGGIPTETYTKDGLKLDSMIIRYKDLLKQIESHGGEHRMCFPIKDSYHSTKGKEHHLDCKEFQRSTGEFIDVIIPDATSEHHAKWAAFSKNTLSKLGLETVTITMQNGQEVKGYVTKHWSEKNPTRPNDGLCFVRANAPTENFPMGKRDVMRRVLGLKADEFLFDYRGSGKSQGMPSEGGYYLDIEAAIDKVTREYGYDMKRVVVDGFCLGGGVAFHAKQRYHSEGINLFTQNTFCCMHHTLQQQVFPANYIAPLGNADLGSHDPAVVYHLGSCGQDGFHNAGKLNGLEGKEGVSIIINTDTDTTVHKDSHERLVSSVEKVSRCFPIWFDRAPDGRNGHSFDVLSDRKTWDEVFTYLTAIDHPEILTG